MLVRARLKADLGAARKDGDAERVAVIRTLLAAIGNAEAVELGPSHPTDVQGWAEVPRRRLSAEDILGIVRREADELRAAAADYEGRGAAQEAARLRKSAEYAEEYLTRE